MQSLDKKNLNLLRGKMSAALQAVATEFGLKIEVGSCRFNLNSAEFKVEVSTISSDGTVNSREAVAFQRNASFFGLEPTDLGRTFRSGGETYTITGLRPNAPRFPVLAERADGRSFKFPSENVKALLAAMPR